MLNFIIENLGSLDALALALLILAGGLAGFIDSIAGGGGIITVPALLAAGLPPHLALGTNKLQASFGSLSAALSYRAQGLVSFRSEVPGILATILGASLGTVAILQVSPGLLKIILPLILGLVSLFLLFRPQGTMAQVKNYPPYQLGVMIAGLAIGFYDGFIGPGTGTFWVLSLSLGLGVAMNQATAKTKVFNFTSNIISLGVFIASGSVLLVPGLSMGMAQIIGSQLGAKTAIKRGPGFIKAMVGVTTMGMLVYVVIRNFVLEPS